MIQKLILGLELAAGACSFAVLWCMVGIAWASRCIDRMIDEKEESTR